MTFNRAESLEKTSVTSRNPGVEGHKLMKMKMKMKIGGSIPNKVNWWECL